MKGTQNLASAGRCSDDLNGQNWKTEAWSLEFHPDLLQGWEEPKHLGHPPWFSPSHWQGTESKVEQLRDELGPKYLSHLIRKLKEELT